MNSLRSSSRTRSRPWTGAAALATLALLVVSTQRGALAEGAAYTWTHVETHNGVQLFTSRAERHSYDVVRGTAVIPVEASRVIAALQAFERYPAWYHNAAEVRVLRLPTTVAAIGFGADGSPTHVPETGPWVLYIRQHAPHLEDRWTLLRCGLRAGPSGSIMVEFHSLRRTQASHEEAVQMDLRGYWLVRPRGRTHTEVTFMVDADPNTIVPALLVDPELHNVVTQTLLNLRKYVTADAQRSG
jgi:hypothetical protein